MSPRTQPASSPGARRTSRAGGGRWWWLWYVLAVLATGPVTGVIQRQLGFLWSMAYWLVLLCFLALLYLRQIHRRGQTIAEAMAASRAERRRRVAARERERLAVAALPWVHDKRLSFDAVPGVLITPPPNVPGYQLAGHDIVLDSPGDQKIHVVRQIMRLTRLSPKAAKDLVESAPSTVLRVPDLTMAHAAQCILETAGATVSISAGPGDMT